MTRTAAIYATAGDTGRTVGVRLDDDGTPVNLAAAQAIEAHMANVDTGDVTIISGLTGDAGGNVSTELPTLVEGTFTLEWQVTTAGGDIATFPDEGRQRPRVFVRPEAA